MKIAAANSAPWNIAESDNGGMPRLIRYRTDLVPFIASSDYPQRLVIIWEYDAVNLNGMPSTEQSETMKCFEDALDATLDSDRIAVLAFVLTCNGSREWHYYINRVEEVGLESIRPYLSFQSYLYTCRLKTILSGSKLALYTKSAVFS